jgi:alcohol dehydrogenase class IV
MQFEFATATRIVFGPGKHRETGSFAASMGRRALVVTGSYPARSAVITEPLAAQGVETTAFIVTGEPSVATALNGVQVSRREGCDLVIACGGGSVLDAGKAIAALMANPGDPMDYLEVIGRGLPLARSAAPCICIPTTSGTGSEVTRNSVLSSPDHRVKVSLRSPLMLPRLALVDPVLTHTLPPDLTATTGLDALTQLIEPYVCNSATPLTDAVCREGISLAARSLHRVCKDGSDAEARENMALASLYGGLALANAKLGAVHGLAGPLGGMFPAPHGAVCARLLPFVMEANVRALRSRVPGSPALSRYDVVSRLLNGKTTAKAEEGVAWVQSLCADLNIPPLSRYGITEAAFPSIVAQAGKASSMKGNPVMLLEDELTEILRRAL